MNLLPKIKKCPQCGVLNLVKINGIIYENTFKSFADWTLKRIFDCRKCKIKLGLFTLVNEKKEKLVWIDLLKCEESYYDHLSQLQTCKVKCKKQSVKFYETQKKINDIQDKIRLDQIKLKIKTKIEKIRSANLIRIID